MVPTHLHALVRIPNEINQLRAAACLGAGLPGPEPGQSLEVWSARAVLCLLERGETVAAILEQGRAFLASVVEQERRWQSAVQSVLEYWCTPGGAEYLSALDAGMHLAGDAYRVVEQRWGYRPDGYTAAVELAAYWWVQRQDALSARSLGGERPLSLEDLRWLLSAPYTVRDELAVASMRARAGQVQRQAGGRNLVMEAIENGKARGLL